MVFYFKDTIEDIIMTKENQEDFINIITCRFCEKKLFLIK